MISDDIYLNIKNEEVICMPTDTIVGLIADSRSDRAIKKIYELKKRELLKPLSLLVNNYEMADKYISLNKTAKKLLTNPILSVTIIANSKTSNLSKYINFEQKSFGIRITRSEILLEVLNKHQYPLVATSANLSGQENIFSLPSLKKLFGNNVKYYDLSAINNNSASPIIDCRKEKIQIIRATKEQRNILAI